MGRVVWTIAALACLAGCADRHEAGGIDAGGDPEPAVDAADARDEDPADVAASRLLPGGIAPLTDEQRRILWSSPEDDVPASRVDSRHFVHSNEQKHHLFFPYMDCTDGGYLGVGSDQNYTLLARCRARYAWIVDYDESIPLLHAVHRAFILESETPSEFVGRWSEESEESSLEILRKRESQNPRLGDIEKLYVKYREKLRKHFEDIAKRRYKGEPASWIADERDYAYVRGMFMAERIRPMLGNLLADRAIRGIGQASRDLGITVRAIYLTNVEELVHYNQAFRDSMRSLPVDDRSVVLRTLAYTHGYPIADRKWHYNVEPALDFQEKLGKTVKRIQGFMPGRKETDVVGLSTLGM